MTLLLTVADRGGLPEWLLYYQRLSMGLEVEVASFCSWILSNWSCNGTKFLKCGFGNCCFHCCFSTSSWNIANSKRFRNTVAVGFCCMLGLGE